MKDVAQDKAVREARSLTREFYCIRGSATERWHVWALGAGRLGSCEEQGGQIEVDAHVSNLKSRVNGAIC